MNTQPRALNLISRFLHCLLVAMLLTPNVADAGKLGALVKALKLSKSGAAIDSNGKEVPENLILSKNQLLECFNTIKMMDRFRLEYGKALKEYSSSIENINSRIEARETILEEIKNSIDNVDESIKQIKSRLSTLSGLLEIKPLPYDEQSVFDTHNQRVNEYNSLIKKNKSKVEKYNSLVSDYNAIANSNDDDEIIESIEHRKDFLDSESKRHDQILINFNAKCAEHYYMQDDAISIGLLNYYSEKDDAAIERFKKSFDTDN